MDTHDMAGQRLAWKAREALAVEMLDQKLAEVRYMKDILRLIATHPQAPEQVRNLAIHAIDHSMAVVMRQRYGTSEILTAVSGSCRHESADHVDGQVNA